MMVDSDSTDTRGPTVDLLKEKEDDGGFVSGWWKRLVLGSVICYCVCFWLMFQEIPVTRIIQACFALANAIMKRIDWLAVNHC